MALDWAHRVIGLRGGQMVLDQPASGLDKDALVQVYQRDTAEDPSPHEFLDTFVVPAEAHLP